VLATCWSVEDVNHVSVITTPTLVIRTLDNAMSVFSVLYYSTIKVIWRKESLPLLQFAIACFFFGGGGWTHKTSHSLGSLGVPPSNTLYHWTLQVYVIIGIGIHRMV